MLQLLYFLMQFPTNGLGKKVENGLSDWASATHIEDSGEACLHPGSTLLWLQLLLSSGE